MKRIEAPKEDISVSENEENEDYDHLRALQPIPRVSNTSLGVNKSQTDNHISEEKSETQESQSVNSNEESSKSEKKILEIEEIPKVNDVKPIEEIKTSES